MLELRRRVQADPASIAFAQLAEECRRLGSNEEAADICRAGLARNPGYLSARVTLGRALIELGQLDAAKTELEIVITGAPDNLAAIRGLAEILQRRGQMKEALGYYKRALELARHDRDLEQTVERITLEVAPPAPQPHGPAVSIEEIFNFDTLIDQLGLGPVAPEAAAAVPSEVAHTASREIEPESASAAELPTREGVAEVADGTETNEGPAFEDLFAEPPAELAPESPSSQDLPSLEELFAEPIAADSSTSVGGPEMLDAVTEADPLEDFFAEIPTEPSADPPVTEAPLEGYFAEASPAIEPAVESFASFAEDAPVIDTALESVELTLDDSDSLAVMERQLRELEQQRTADERRARMELAERRRGAMVVALETWLSAIVADRERLAITADRQRPDA